MENNTKIAIGLAAAVVVGYIVYNKSKKPKTPTQSGSTSKCKGEFAVECNDGSCDIGNGIVRPCLGKGGQKGTKPEPECICKQYPCNCGASTNGYGYEPKSATPEEIERLQADRISLSGNCPQGYTYNSLAGCIPYVMTE